MTQFSRALLNPSLINASPKSKLNILSQNLLSDGHTKIKIELQINVKDRNLCIFCVDGDFRVKCALDEAGSDIGSVLTGDGRRLQVLGVDGVLVDLVKARFDDGVESVGQLVANVDGDETGTGDLARLGRFFGRMSHEGRAVEVAHGQGGAAGGGETGAAGAGRTRVGHPQLGDHVAFAGAHHAHLLARRQQHVAQLVGHHE